MLKKIALGILLAAAAGTASASTAGITCHTEYFFGFPFEVCSIDRSKPHPVAAPEIDSSSAIAGLTLMLGGLAVLSSRRKKNIEA